MLTLMMLFWIGTKFDAPYLVLGLLVDQRDI